jgi:hypothetical protein
LDKITEKYVNREKKANLYIYLYTVYIYTHTVYIYINICDKNMYG